MKKIRKMTPSQVIILGFMLLILIGGLLLTLPIASRHGETTPLLDALFTSTSAVCVTGLVVYNTATKWSLFGQCVILILIQLGGMGFVMVALMLGTLTGRKISLASRNIMLNAISAHQIGGIVKLTRFIFTTIVLIEVLGAVFLSFVFIPQYGVFHGLWLSIFHSISAFCNAGFDILGMKQPFVSLTAYRTSWIVNLTICLLIIIGGIGFLTWDDIYRYRLRFHRYRLQTKVILMTTVMLITFPFLYFFMFEFSHEPFSGRFLYSFFQAVTPRTAGFNTIDYTQLSDVGKLMTIMLMLIGGAPGSTAGGMKVTTMAILVLTMRSVFKKRDYITWMGRRIKMDTLKNAVAIFMMYVVLLIVSTCLISLIEPFDILTIMFEVASALGTVGLTLGITTQLSSFSKIILILLMYLGRVGALTLIYAAISQDIKAHVELVAENISVG